MPKFIKFTIAVYQEHQLILKPPLY